jgi:hypothetical protein
MPRTISRLRYKAPPAPVAFHARNGGELSGRKLERKVYAYVNSQSNPRNVRLQVVVNPKARLPATGQTTIAPRKPFTLRDVVDPNGQALHGEIIYVFRNIKSNQVIYSLQELLHVRLRIPEAATRCSHITGPPPRTVALHWQALEATRPATRRMDTALRHHFSLPRARSQRLQETARASENTRDLLGCVQSRMEEVAENGPDEEDYGSAGQHDCRPLRCVT